MGQREVSLTLPAHAARVIQGFCEAVGAQQARTRHEGTGLVTLEVVFDEARPAFLEDRIEAWLGLLEVDEQLVLQTASRPGEWQPGWSGIYQGQVIGGFSLRPPWTPPRATGIDLVIDPRGGFGSGMHPTTRGALLLLERLAPHGAGRTLLDVGAGSGILSIAAAKLGYQVAATEIEPLAIAACRRQAEANGVQVELLDPDLRLLPRPFDVVLANVHLAVLERLAPELIPAVRPGGLLILGGLYTRQRDALRQRYASLSCREELPSDDGEWICFAFDA